MENEPKQRKKPGPVAGSKNEPKQRKKPGPVAGSKSGPERAKTSMEIDVELIEWGKAQPGGLSELVRRLLREEKAKTSE